MKKVVVILLTLVLVFPLVFGQSNRKKRDYLGRLSANKYSADSTSNRFGNLWMSIYGTTVLNLFSYGRNSPVIIGKGGKYLGRLNRNRYDPESVANPYGRYGSKYSADSINNIHGRYGSPFSNESARNPFATDAPKLYAPESNSNPQTPRLKWDLNDY